MDKELGQKTILNLYAAFGVSLIFSFLPNLAAGLFGMVLFIGVLIAAYVVRGKSEAQSFSENHTIYIIRTFWISSLFGLVSFAVAIAYMLNNGIDFGVVQGCVNFIFYGAFSMLEPCIRDFYADNQSVFVNAAMIGIGPILVYIVYRLYRGVSRAVGGYRLADVRAWF